MSRRTASSAACVLALLLLVSATGYTGSPGYELYLAAHESEALFETILDAGEREGVRPAGLGARDTLRL